MPLTLLTATLAASVITVASPEDAASSIGSDPATLAPDFTSLAGAAFSFAPAADVVTSTLSLGGEGFASEIPQDANASGATTAPASSMPESAGPDRNRFFHRGSWRWQITGAGATDFGDETLGLAGFAASFFMADAFTIDFEANGLYADQSDGDNAGAINFAMLLRWHFWRSADERWSIYADAGAGILFSTNDIPADGSSFNFTPQAGMGVSVLLDPATDARLLTGFRWYHISNANTFENNPGTNTLMLYAGVNFPF